MNKTFYLLAFESTSHSIAAQRLARERFSIAVLPTPTEITAGCGLSIRFADAELPAIVSFTDGLRIPCTLYRMSEKGANGRRTAQRLKEHCGEVTG